MSFAEIEDQIAALTVEERVKIAALIAHLNSTADSEYLAELDRRMTRMDAGFKSTLSDLESLHQKLSDAGK